MFASDQATRTSSCSDCLWSWPLLFLLLFAMFAIHANDFSYDKTSVNKCWSIVPAVDADTKLTEIAILSSFLNSGLSLLLLLLDLFSYCHVITIKCLLSSFNCHFIVCSSFAMCKFYNIRNIRVQLPFIRLKLLCCPEHVFKMVFDK